MKEAGIITVYGDYENYGNRLQNYAVQEALKKVGVNAKTIKLVTADTVDTIHTDYNKNRYDNFKHFNEYINFHDEELDVREEVSKDYGKNFNYYVVGSDQIWNFTFKNLFKPAVFASFTDKPKVALSASLGVDFMPEENSEAYNLFKNNIDKFKKVSVRENEGKKILENISDREDIKALVDPTMLLDREDWEKVIRRPSFLETDRFILQEFLGREGDNRKKEIERIAEEFDCEIIDVLDKDSEYFGIGPTEFLYLVKNSFMIATDSFHACVFSILFNKPFIVFKRDDERLKSMHSRIVTLLSTFGLEDRMFTGIIDDSHLNIDYNKVNKILEEKRVEGYEFLKEAFEE